MELILSPWTIFEFPSNSIISVSKRPSREALINVIKYLTLATSNLASRISKTFSAVCEMPRFSSFLSPNHANHQRIYIEWKFNGVSISKSTIKND